MLVSIFSHWEVRIINCLIWCIFFTNYQPIVCITSNSIITFLYTFSSPMHIMTDCWLLIKSCALLMWCLRLCLCLNSLLHQRHENLLWSECTAMCSLMYSFRENVLPHKSHENGRSPDGLKGFQNTVEERINVCPQNTVSVTDWFCCTTVHLTPLNRIWVS